ncbi:MAG: cation diffusion facilitator family transporter, partial [Chloroflexota bacterium]
MSRRTTTENKPTEAQPHAGVSTAGHKNDAQPARMYVVLAILAAVVTIGLKASAWLLTGSVGMLSDAAEGLINLAAALVAFWMLTVAARPPDEEHAYGHTKAEYFSSGVESSLILVAAAVIAWFAVGRLWNPQPLENIGVGLGISVVASVINGGVAFVLLRAGRKLNSITLTADGRHLLTDVWTSVGVLVAILLIGLTGWLILDPLIALLVAANVVFTGMHLLSDSAHGLLDTALPAADQAVIASVQAHYREAEGIDFHALRTRQAGQRRFISMHVLVPGDWSVERGHTLCELIER